VLENELRRGLLVRQAGKLGRPAELDRAPARIELPMHRLQWRADPRVALERRPQDLVPLDDTRQSGLQALRLGIAWEHDRALHPPAGPVRLDRPKALLLR
jgi:hypothetical protein